MHRISSAVSARLQSRSLDMPVCWPEMTQWLTDAWHELSPSTTACVNEWQVLLWSERRQINCASFSLGYHLAGGCCHLMLATVHVHTSIALTSQLPVHELVELGTKPLAAKVRVHCHDASLRVFIDQTQVRLFPFEANLACQASQSYGFVCSTFTRHAAHWGLWTGI